MPTRCFWATTDDPLYQAYHDQEWGVPVHDDRLLFEFLILEGAQAGLSWYTILRKRQITIWLLMVLTPKKSPSTTTKGIRVATKSGDNPQPAQRLTQLFVMPRVLLNIQQEFGSLDSYLWDFVGWKTHYQCLEDRVRRYPHKTEYPDR